MKVIVGLGNPGKEYENTKHNIGFLTLDRLSERLGISIKQIKHKALTGEGFVKGQKLMLVKPQTYMNLSGQCVREVMQYYKLEPENLIVIYDDLDIPIGTLRLRAKGSAGTHNGMKSIIYDIQEDGFPRVRVGIGGERKGNLANYVISGFRKEDINTVETAVEKAADAVECWIDEGINAAMNKFNTKKEKKKKEKPESEELEIAENNTEKSYE
ncbi:MAG: aminoacyl-tRNA hydrolase [Anaerovoracaceae bacterium]